LTSTSGALTRTYGYDNAGNTTSYDGITFTYNNRGRMKSSPKNGVTTNYTYNALGQLIKKGTSALYYYDDAGHIIGIYSGTGALTEEIVWLGDTPIVSLRPRAGGGINIYNIHTDHLNTPRLITGSVNPGVRWRWDSEPFGAGGVNNNPSGVGVFNFDLRFPGQIAMVEAGLHYNYYRDYDPATGRYVQSDPIGLDGGINTYSYVGARPLQYSDPLGLWVPSMHNRMSREAANLAKCSKRAGELGSATASVDDGRKFPGTQAPENSFWHAMSDGIAGQSPEEASDQYDEYMNTLATSCDIRDIGRRLHALQDSFSPAHRGFKSWRGFRLRDVFGLIGHGFRDSFASPSTYNRSVDASRSLIEQVRETCPCFCQ
jgi:RHS repeat-associated protein